MLTKDDLEQISCLLDQKFEQKLTPIENELKSHGIILKSLKKDHDIMLDMLDREQMDQKKKIKRIEKHLDLPPLVS